MRIPHSTETGRPTTQDDLQHWGVQAHLRSVPHYRSNARDSLNPNHSMLLANMPVKSLEAIQTAFGTKGREARCMGPFAEILPNELKQPDLQ